MDSGSYHNPTEGVNLSFGVSSQKLVFCAWAVLLSQLIGCNSTTSPSTSPPPVLMAKGLVVFQNVCSSCHGADAKGSVGDTVSKPGYDIGGFPPLYNSDFIKANLLRPVYILFLGAPNFLDSPITVNGHIYQNTMPAYGGGGNLSDSDIAGVLTYVRATFDGATDYILPEEVHSIRDTLIADCKNDSLPKYCDTSQYVPQ